MVEKRMGFGQATVDAMRWAMREDERVLVLGEDISWGGNFGQFRGLVEEFGPERVIDMPISEAIIVATAVGAAVTGLRPVASMSFVEFTLGAMDEIVNQAAKFRYMFGGQVSVPMVLRASDGVLRSSAAQHSSSLEGIFTHLPGLKVPADHLQPRGLRPPTAVLVSSHSCLSHFSRKCARDTGAVSYDPGCEESWPPARPCGEAAFRR